jgi:hypothetical protein
MNRCENPGSNPGTGSKPGSSLLPFLFLPLRKMVATETVLAFQVIWIVLLLILSIRFPSKRHKYWWTHGQLELPRNIICVSSYNLWLPSFLEQNVHVLCQHWLVWIWKESCFWLRFLCNNKHSIIQNKLWLT